MTRAAATPPNNSRWRAQPPSVLRFSCTIGLSLLFRCQQPPKTLKFKPLVTHAQEPSSAPPSAKRGDSRVHPPPPPATPTSAATAASRSRSPRRPRPDLGGGGDTSAGSSAVGVKKGEGPGARPRLASGVGGRGDGGHGHSGEDVDASVCFKSLQV